MTFIFSLFLDIVKFIQAVLEVEGKEVGQRRTCQEVNSSLDDRARLTSIALKIFRIHDLKKVKMWIDSFG